MRKEQTAPGIVWIRISVGEFVMHSGMDAMEKQTHINEIVMKNNRDELTWITYDHAPNDECGWLRMNEKKR